MASNPNTQASDDSHGDFQLPLGYAGALRIRAAPRIILTPKPQGIPALKSLEDWRVVVGGECQNVMDAIPCRLEWNLTSDRFADRSAAHPRETLIVPEGKGFVVQEKDGEGMRPLRISVLELGLIGKGTMGYRLEPLLFGNEAVEVLPTSATAIAFDLTVEITHTPTSEELEREWISNSPGWMEKAAHELGHKFVGLVDKVMPERLQGRLFREKVGTVVSFQTKLPALFKGMKAVLEIWPRPVSGGDRDEGALVRLEWEVGDPRAASRLLWRIGFMTVTDAYLLTVWDRQLVVVGGGESPPTLTFDYQISLSPVPSPEKRDKDKKPAETMPSLYTAPRQLLEVPRPRLTKFELKYEKDQLVAEGESENFADSVQLDVVLETYTRRPAPPDIRPPRLAPSEEQESSWQSCMRLDDYLRHVFPSPWSHDSRDRSSSNVAFMEDFVVPADFEERAQEAGQVYELLEDNKFRRVVLDLRQMPREYLKILKRARSLQFFVTLQLAPSVTSRPQFCLHYFLDYQANADQKEGGFAPFRDGQFVSRDFAPAVCTSNTMDLERHAEHLYTPIPMVPVERQEEFYFFVATVCGESLGQSPASWKSVAHTIMNRVACRWETWTTLLTPTEVIKNSGFDGSKNELHHQALAFLRAPPATMQKYPKVPATTWSRIRQILELCVPIFMDLAGDGGGPVYFYSPKAQKQLYGKVPGFLSYLEEPVRLVCVTEKLLKGATDDFQFYAFKHPDRSPRMTQREINEAKAARAKKRSD